MTPGSVPSITYVSIDSYVAYVTKSLFRDRGIYKSHKSYTTYGKSRLASLPSAPCRIPQTAPQSRPFPVDTMIVSHGVFGHFPLWESAW